MNRLTCEETFRRLDDFLDRELTPHEMDLVREHLEQCAVCSSEYSFEAALLKSVRDKLRRVSAPADLIARVSARLRQVVEEEQGKADERARE